MKLTSSLFYSLLLILLCCRCQTAVDSKKGSGEEQTTVLAPDTLIPTPAAIPIPPPIPLPDYDTTEWADIHLLDTTIVLDLRYATSNNFVEEQMYDCGRCFLRPAVAKGIVKVHRLLQEEGLGLKMFDCYRPRPIQWKLWNKVPDRRYVSDPRKGSMHNRGAAVDLTIVDDKGEQLEMGTTYDFFGPEAWSTHQDLPDSVLANRIKLKTLLEAEGFAGIRTEWWHFSYPGKGYALSDMLWNCE